MTSSNLSICVGPSILWTQDPQYSLDPAYTKVGALPCLGHITESTNCTWQLLLEELNFGPDFKGTYNQCSPKELHFIKISTSSPPSPLGLQGGNEGTENSLNTLI